MTPTRSFGSVGFQAGISTGWMTGSKSDKSCRPASHYINDAAAAAAGRVETVALSSPANRGARPEAAGANVSFAPFDLQSR
jgi:hypothetical protein